MDAETSTEMEFWRNLDRYLLRLQDEDKHNRRSILKTIYTQVKCMDSFHPPYELDNDPRAQGECTALASNNIIETQIALFIRPILRCISDTSEKCREIAYDILSLIFDRMCLERGLEFLPIVLPLLVQKFGQPEINEPSEEVRLHGYQFIMRLVGQLKDRVGPFVNDLVSICVNGLTDSFLDIRIMTCSIVITIAQYGKQNFHFLSGRLVGALSASVNHQQHRVRSAMVSCIGIVVLYGNNTCLDSLLHPLTTRVFDQSTAVRRGVIEVVGNWMINYVERHSCFHKLLPVLLSGFYDDIQENVDLTKSLWLKVGEQFLFDNLENYRDLADFPPVIGAGITRPTTGCKILTEQNIGKLLPAICKEITDWQVSTRIKSVQLLHCLIYNAEDKVTMHLNEIIDCLVKASIDENSQVKEYIDKSSELLGLYVPLQVIWPVLVAEIEQVSNTYRHYGALKIAGPVLDNANPLVVETYMKGIAILISEKCICHSREEKNQFCLIDICSALLKPQPDIAAREIKDEVFYILLATTGLTESAVVKKRAAELLKKLQYVLGINTFDEFMADYCRPILEEMKRHCREWTSQSPEKLIFELIWTHGGLTLERNWETILDIMVLNLSPTKDPKVRVNFFTKLSIQLNKNHGKSRESKDILEQFLRVVIQDVLDPNMAWQAGETAVALRTSALGCLHAILDGKYMSSQLLVEISPCLIANMLPMMDESLEITRCLVCKSLRLLVEGCERKLDVKILHKIYPELLKRLDDAKLPVRATACQAIEAVFTNTPTDYEKEYKSHVEYVYSILVLHLDDDEIMGQVLSTLKRIGELNPECLINECEKVRDKQRSSKLCDELIGRFQQMKIEGCQSKTR